MLGHSRMSCTVRVPCTLLVAASALGQGRFQDLGALPGHTESRALAVSADGGTVVGWSSGGSAMHAFRWTEPSGMQDLGVGLARGVSAGGDVVVGGAGGLFTLRAFRWTAALGAVDLGTVGGATSEACAVNADGSVVVGWSLDTGGLSRAFRWTAAAGMQDIGSGVAFGVSANGSVVVGNTLDSSGIGGTAYLWHPGTGRQELLPGSWSTARAVSADGATVVGVEYDQAFPGFGEARPFRWTAAGGWALIDSTRQSWASGVNADGSVVAGHRWSAAFNGYRADRWTASQGTLDLGPLATASYAFAMSSDGSVVVGGAQRAFRWFSSGLGERYCAPVPNSTGRGGLLDVNGSDVVALNDVRLAAEFLPVAAFGFFLVSRDLGSIYPVPQSQGRLCLGGAIGHYDGAGQVQSSGATGRIELALDLGAIPTPPGPVAAQPGDTWHFQAWHRDANPGPTSNFTDAVRVTLY